MESPSTTPIKSWTHRCPPFPTTLSLESLPPPLPSSLSPHSILLETYYSSLNPVDIQISNLSIFKLKALQGTFGQGLGKDFVGRVLAKGKEVRDEEYQVGNVIMGVTFNPLGGPLSGTLSEITLLDTTRTCAITKPPQLYPLEAASLPLVFLTAKTLLSQPYFYLPSITPPSSARDNDGDDDDDRKRLTTIKGKKRYTIVILGGSTSVGIYTIQYALKRFKDRIRIVTTCSRRNFGFVKSLATVGNKEQQVDEEEEEELIQLIDYQTENVQSRLKELKPVEGYLSIIDCIGGTTLFQDNFHGTILSPRSPENDGSRGGNYVTIVGDKTSRDRLGGSFTNWFNPRQVWRHWKGRWGWGCRYDCIDLDMTKKEWLKELEELVTEEGGLKVVVEEEFGFEEVPKAFEKLMEGKSRGKIVVRVKPQDG